MPEGHTLHRLARALGDRFAGAPVRAASPQGRFSAGAALLDGTVPVTAEAIGKHLVVGVAPAADLEPERFLRVHLGLYGSWRFLDLDGGGAVIGAPRRVDDRGEDAETGPGGIPAPGPNVRLRLRTTDAIADLTGPAACEVITAAEVDALADRIGPDPLRDDADPARFLAKVARTSTAIGALLMDQSVIGGVGNIYRAEVLFRAGLDPAMPGRELTRGMARGLWTDLVGLMRYGARTGRIVTTEPEHRDLHAQIRERVRTRQNGDEDPDVVPREKSFYVYHRQGLPCRVCGREVLVRELAGRSLYWCGRCQTPRRRRRTLETVFAAEPPPASATRAAGARAGGDVGTGSGEGVRTAS